MIRKYLVACVLACSAIAWSHSAMAQEYPTRPVRIVVPFLPGAGKDTLGRRTAEFVAARLGAGSATRGRMTAEFLTPRRGQSVFVENKAGAGSQIGIDLVAKSPPDGYNLVWAASDGITILPAVKAAMPYKVPEDFSFIARIVQIPFVIAVNPDLPIRNAAELRGY